MKLEVNGKEVSGLSECSPRKGYLALESEGAECHFRNLQIKELPSTNPKASEIADVAQGFQNLLTGLELPGWKLDDEGRKHWKVNDWFVRYDGQGGALVTAVEHGNAEFIVDFRFPNAAKGESAKCEFRLRPDNGMKIILGSDGNVTLTTPDGTIVDATKKFQASGKWNRLRVSVNGNKSALLLNGNSVLGGELAGVPAKGTFSITPSGAMDFGNIYVREIK
jgi:hypothetical protein